MLVTTFIVRQDDQGNDILETTADAFETTVCQERIKQYTKDTASLDSTMYTLYNIV